MSFLRRISTRRLLALCAAVVGIAAATTAVAMATAGAGPKPSAESLPVAVHDALSAPSVPGISANVQFTNRLVDASALQGQGSDPFISGATGRLWASPQGGRLRLELQSEGGGGDSQVLINEGRFQIYDGSSGTLYTGVLPSAGHSAGGSDGHQPPTLEEVRQAIDRLGAHVVLSGAIPSDVGGQPTYTLRVEPKSDGGLFGGAELAWDAVNGTPLRAALYAKGNSSAVIELEATEVSFETVPSSVFEISPPPETKVVELTPPSGGSREGEHSTAAPVSGAAAVQGQLGFHLSAPAKLAGMAQGEVRAIRVSDKAGALITYGQGLGGIAVIESASSPTPSSGGGQGTSETGGLSLPSVSIDGANAEELETALGTVLRFTRGGVEYVVAGSVPPATAEAAARGL